MTLLPCPFCGDMDWTVVDNDREISVRCDHCGARGPWADTVNRAKVIWNARIQPLPPPLAYRGKEK